jgi:excinuclease ABC subunit B
MSITHEIERLQKPFELVSEYRPAGDQPRAIEELVTGFNAGKRSQTLMGVTGSGKTMTMANVIQQLQRPTLVISHNKTLAAQLYGEFREFFPNNAVEYFVSYYDYYQPEAYIPQRDIYIEKDASINEEIDRLRLRATSALMSRSDVVIVASVSCIYGIGSPEEYAAMIFYIRKGATVKRSDILSRLVELQYERNDTDFKRGTFRVRGDVIEVWPAYEEIACRIELFGDEVDALMTVNPTSAEVLGRHTSMTIYPAKHFVTSEERLEAAINGIATELEERLEELKFQKKLLEAQRLQSRTKYDLEMLMEVGYCSGIENYSRHLDGRDPGTRPHCLIDYFPDDYLLIIDESHVTVPQIAGMFAGDRSRKSTLVDHGFRLPSALDNRPMNFDEFQQKMTRTLFVSATPGPYELEQTGGEVVEQIIRPTGLVDPVIHVKSARDQVPDLLEETDKRVDRGERVLVTTLTKRLCEDLNTWMGQRGYRSRYLHSEIDAIERVEILRELREGKFDVLIGVNLLREGLDLPEVSLVAILDADKEGFLRSETSLIQTIGRTARNVNAEVILYADKITNSMQRAIDETERRRERQLAYNEEHNITPTTIRKAIRRGIEAEIVARKKTAEAVRMEESQLIDVEVIKEMEKEMLEKAENLEFEEAAKLRDQILKLKPDYEFQFKI